MFSNNVFVHELMRKFNQYSLESDTVMESSKISIYKDCLSSYGTRIFLGSRILLSVQKSRLEVKAKENSIPLNNLKF